MKHIYLLLLFIFNLGFTQTVVPLSNLYAYYDGDNVDYSSSNTDLHNQLATKIIGSLSTFLSYSDKHDFLYDADTTPNDPNNVTLIHSGEVRPDDQLLSGSNPTPPSNQTYNTEHVWPKSLLGSGIAEADLHLLRACDIAVNSSRDNNPFIDGNGTPNQQYFSTGSAFFPGWDWRGDIARIVLYVNLRYNVPFSDVGSLALFLEWNASDPVADNGIEDNRNTVISGAQGNMNPFIDNPYLANLIWGGTPAQNRWAVLSTEDFQQPEVKIFPNPARGNEITIASNSAVSVEIYDILGKKVKQQNITANQKKVNISTLKKGVYLLRLKSDSGTLTKKLIRQ
ncbi:MAG: T9SS type A sorting domain-containing protein [Winogradskyella sp.]|uniref:endonuclease n=1 Tax=Winogradskyella sp. TaxID=1883156 RepID=UPI0017D6030B|nr:endonuclease [Winogradskyella sp.]MBT8244582.1 endonuclease [Winogradskyella sp.]NNK23094.1 T9SS type A sorting domain-containing protein [Winogradskyella sp.]